MQNRKPGALDLPGQGRNSLSHRMVWCDSCWSSNLSNSVRHGNQRSVRFVGSDDINSAADSRLIWRDVRIVWCSWPALAFQQRHWSKIQVINTTGLILTSRMIIPCLDQLPASIFKVGVGCIYASDWNWLQRKSRTLQFHRENGTIQLPLHHASQENRATTGEKWNHFVRFESVFVWCWLDLGRAGFYAILEGKSEQ